jgi:hypothetical protein
MQPISIPTDEEFLNILESKLGDLAARWRGTDNSAEAEALVHQYQTILRSLIELGYQRWLDADAELPDEYLPAEYLNRATKGS